jgi:hypothetical protein
MALSLSIREARRGTMVKATIREQKMAKLTVIARGLNKTDARPSANIMGKKTAIMVEVEAITA